MSPSPMHIGLSAPQIGPLADPAAVREVAVAAEDAGFHSLWVLDRLLAPLAPQDRYPGTPDGSLPEPMRVVLDPIGVLGLAAAVTERIRVGTNVLVVPWYEPVVLGRALTTLDIVSGGRLDVGLGVGWSTDECEAVGVTRSKLASRMEDALDLLDAVWTDPVVEHQSEFRTVHPSTIEPKPVQGRPPILLAAFTPAGLDRIARRADGWLPVGLPHDVLAMMWNGLRDAAAGHGRDPDELRLVVRANVVITDRPIDGERPVFLGSLEQIVEDVHATRAIGAHELTLDLHGVACTAGEYLDAAAAVVSAAELSLVAAS